MIFAFAPIGAHASMTLGAAMQSARDACTGIADEMTRMKTLAGINVAVTGVGTAAGGGALVTGLIKASTDETRTQLAELRRIQDEHDEDEAITPEMLAEFRALSAKYAAMPADELAKLNNADAAQLDQRSRNLGHWRTGLMAGSVATNVAGAIIAGRNKVGEDLKSDIDGCRNAVAELARVRLQSRSDGLADTDPAMTAAQKIIDECQDYNTITDAQIQSINRRANTAMWASITGVTVGAAGTVTSVMANTDATRQSESENKERNLNVASNVLAGGVTLASATAVVFNATQISAINRISAAADKCEGAMR